MLNRNCKILMVREIKKSAIGGLHFFEESRIKCGGRDGTGVLSLFVHQVERIVYIPAGRIRHSQSDFTHKFFAVFEVIAPPL